MTSLSASRVVSLALIVAVAALFVWVQWLGADDRGNAQVATAGASAEAERLEDTPPAVAPPDLGAAPAIVDISQWLNTQGRRFEDVRGEVTIVQFWTFGCSNCKATIPQLQRLYAEYEPDGLEIIGIHAHEFDYERDPANVTAAVAELGVTWPVALDTDKTNFREWQGSPRYWPRTYVIDSAGRVRFDHIGEGAYDELEATVAALLDQSA